MIKSKTNIKPNKGITLNKNPLQSSYSSSKISSDISTNSLHNLLNENISLINVKDSQNKTFLSYAIERNNTSNINLIINSPLLDLSYKNKEGNTYIHLSVIYNNIKLVESLIKKGIKLNEKNNKGNTCLHLAYLYNNKKIINMLLEKGADKNIKNNDNKKPEEMKNYSNDNDNKISESKGSTQLDWARKAIDKNIKNNETSKLKSKNENKIKEKEKGYNNSVEQINYKIKLKNNNNDNSEKNIFKPNGYLLKSNKNSDKKEKNKDKNNKMTSSVTNKNIYSYNNIDEEIINMKTLSLVNIKPEIDNLNHTDFISNNEKIYKRIINNRYVFSKNKLKKSVTKTKLNSKIIDNNSLNKIKFLTNEKIIKTQRIFKNKNSPCNNKYNNISKKNQENNICITRDSKNKNEFENNKKIINNSSRNNKKIIYHEINNKHLNLKKDFYTISNDDESKYIEDNLKKELITESNINIDKENGIQDIKVTFNKKNNNNNDQSYKNIINNSNSLNNIQKLYRGSKFKKKIISHKFNLSTNKSMESNLDLLLINFLSQINMQNYFMNLKSNGFDNINLLIEQMKSDCPIKDSELKKAGIIIPGDRAKILIRLEEKGKIFPYEVPKNVYYNLDENTNINENDHINKIKKWLKEFNMEIYLNNFIKNGYYTIELLIYQMYSKNPIDNNILEFDVGIEKIGHRSRILSLLVKESKIFGENIKRFEESIDFKDDIKHCGCLII